MDPRHLFRDDRLSGICVYCGKHPDTRDHVPSKVLLDEPYPSNLSVVDACLQCNSSFSLDEQYLACLIECVIQGTSESSNLERSKVKRILNENVSLRKKLAASESTNEDGQTLWEPEKERIRNTILKLARGLQHMKCILFLRNRTKLIISHLY